MNEKTTVYLTNEEVEVLKRMCQFYDVWKRVFADEFVGSLTIHKAKFNFDIEFEWKIKESYPHFDNLTNKKK